MVYFLNVDIQQFHLSEQFRQPFFHERLTAFFHDLLLRSLGDEVAHTPLIIYNVRASQLVVGLDGRVGIDLQEHAVLTNAGNAVVVIVLACENLITEAASEILNWLHVIL